MRVEAPPAAPRDLSFHCSACGACCNSPPEMTVPELFTHQQRFIGCLAVSRAPRWQVSAHYGADDVAALQRLGRTLNGRAAEAGFVLRTQGHDYASAGRCSALGSDNLCTLHHADKPAACASVPLDPFFPDHLQRVVLQHRAQAVAFTGAGCIVGGLKDGFTPWVVQGQLTDGSHRDDLQRRRQALQAEAPLWADAVFNALAPALRQQPLREGGFRALPLVPVLDVLASRSVEQQARCRDYALAQRSLIGNAISAALQRRNPADREMTRALRSFDTAYAAWIERN